MKKGKGRNNGGLLPSSLRIISSCLKTVSTNASTVASTVRSASASVAASISASEDQKDQVTWAGFDRLELGHSAFKRVLLLGYQNGFQVFDVEDASNYSELVSKRDGPVSFLQMQPYPAASDDEEGFRASHPMLLVVAGDDTNGSGVVQNHSNLGGLGRDGHLESRPGNHFSSPTAVRFYSLRSHSYVHVLRFRSAVCMIRCSPRIVAVGLASQIYCFDALTLENKFSVLTYPVPQLAGQGSSGFNVGYGPMAVGPRWLAYASNSSLMSNTSRLGPHNLTPSPGVSPSTSPGNGSYVARCAMESSKQLAAGIINLGDIGCKTLYKYCQELLPDGSSSPVSSNSGWKVSRLAGTEMDSAGMVVVKDFVTRAVISQFKAHTSPISALCFDPSGTLLVTASIYGNNINIFRIMPLCKRNGSGVQNMNWSSSHVHLYKLHRGITSAMIQDICFSHYSQWVAIVSSKGTCHVFVLSPFGGDAGFQVQHSQGEEPTLYPVLSLPWWSTSSCIMSQQSFPPPPPVVLSVVSRIKYSSFGWLSTVNNAAGSTTGKVFVPSGAVAAVFHNSLSQIVQHSNSRAGTLEHLLVYTPSGHVVQHELQPRVGVEQSHSGLNTQTATYMHMQEEDLRVKVEPIQWWDVCRRSDWPEREDCILGINADRQDVAETIQSKSGSDGTYALEFLDLNGGVEGKRNLETHRSRNISNAEVQINSFRLPIWQKSKICFYTMECQGVDSFSGGEFEVEKVPVHEIEMRQKELLPVFHQFHSIKSSWNDRVLVGKNSNHSSSESHQAEGKISEETVICHSNPASLSSTESSDGGSSRRIEHSLDFDQINSDLPRSPIFQTLNCPERRANAILESSFQNHTSLGTLCAPSEHFKNIGSQVRSCAVLESKLLPVGRFCAEEGLSVKTIGMSEDTDLYTDQHASSTVLVTEGDSNLQRPIDLSQFFQEGHCKALEQNGCLSGVITDDSDGSQCDKGKPDDEENSEMLGGMFAFSDEG
ncbi:putative transcription factor WD40-like family [Rosa chinensis]|uniref:Putative transcription factor WD40-like family n=1 Tax=Rosa chinensis TaxID=74649 RepID=A0A2P6PWB4_ROSCH|nr:autophagy-related protein 18g isoform X1 [Rosa chinensis]PRQ26218.1 putative transcription factor WD40-like family [Rosa chinensis]